MTKMRSKLNLSSITQHENCEVLQFNAVPKPSGYPADGLDEDNTFAKFSPQAEFKITVTNPALHGQFRVGEKYYVDFTPV